jgi:hypothetical protein
MFNTFSSSFRAGRRPGIIKDPTVLVNLQVWYNADVSNTTNFNVAPANGADISQWKDRSGTGHNANQSGNASVKPNWYSNVQNGLGVVRFNGTSESFSINPIAFMQSLPGFTMMLVAKANSLAAASDLTSSDVGGFRIFHDGTNWGVSTSGGTGTSTVPGDTTKFHIFSLIFDGTGIGNAGRLKFRYDDTEQALTFTGTVGTTTSAIAGSFYIASDSTGGAKFFNGDVAEMLMFTRTLNTSELIATETYLKYHWAI